jgi:GxxExxY protein
MHEGSEDAKTRREVIMLRVQSPLSSEEEAIITEAIDCGFTVHRELGPGFREPIYERAYRLELDSRGIRYEAQKEIKVHYKTWEIPGQRIDLLVERFLLVEIKSIRKLASVHRAQVMSYLKTMNLRVGLLMNFNHVTFREGVRRIIR